MDIGNKFCRKTKHSDYVVTDKFCLTNCSKHSHLTTHGCNSRLNKISLGEGCAKIQLQICLVNKIS